jgi:hypothetical protein
MRIKFFRPRTTARLRFRQVGKSSSSGRSRKSQRRFQSLSAYFNIQHWPDQLNDDLLSLVDTRNRSPRPGMAGVHKNTKGLRCPSFRSLMKSLVLFSKLLRNCGSRILQSHAGLLAAGPPKPGNSSPRQCHGRRQPRSWEVVFRRDARKRPG